MTLRGKTSRIPVSSMATERHTQRRKRPTLEGEDPDDSSVKAKAGPSSNPEADDTDDKSIKSIKSEKSKKLKLSRPKDGYKQHVENVKKGIVLLGTNDVGEEVEVSVIKRSDVSGMFYPKSSVVFGTPMTVEQGLIAGALFGRVLVSEGSYITDEDPFDPSELEIIHLYSGSEDINPGSSDMMFKIGWIIYVYLFENLQKENQDVVARFLHQIVESRPDDGIFVTQELRDSLNSTLSVDHRLNETVIFYLFLGILEDVFPMAIRVMNSGFVAHKIDTFGKFQEGQENIHIRNCMIDIILFSSVVRYRDTVYMCDESRGNLWTETTYKSIGEYATRKANALLTAVKYLFLPNVILQVLVSNASKAIADDELCTAKISACLKHNPFIVRPDIIPAMNGILRTNKTTKTVTARPYRMSDMILHECRAPFFIRSNLFEVPVSLPRYATSASVVLDGQEVEMSAEQLTDRWMSQMFPAYDENITYPSTWHEMVAKDSKNRINTFYCFIHAILSGEMTPKKLVCFLGEQGNEGKSILYKILCAMVPPNLVGEASARVFTTSRRIVDTNSNAHSDHMYACMDKRIVASGEVSADKKNSGDIEWDMKNTKGLTSGGVDAIACRAVRGRSTKFVAKCLCFVLGNSLPGMPQFTELAAGQRIFIFGLYSRFGCSKEDPANWSYEQMEMSDTVISIIAGELVARSIEFLRETPINPTNLRYFNIRSSPRIESIQGTDTAPEIVYAKTKEYVPARSCLWEIHRYFKQNLIWVRILCGMIKRRYVQYLNDASVGWDYVLADGTKISEMEEAVTRGMISSVRHDFVYEIDFKDTSDGNHTSVMISQIQAHLSIEVKPNDLANYLVIGLQLGNVYHTRKITDKNDILRVFVRSNHVYWNNI